MRNPRKLAVLALGLSLGLAGLGPAAFAQREFDDDEPEEEVEAADSCSTSQSNESTNSTGDSSQSGLVNINNIALQGLNLDLLGNLLCQGVFLNDIVGGVLGFAEGGDDDGDGEAAECETEQENDSDNSTGGSAQDGLLNVNNIALQGLNLDVLGNGLCDADFLNDLIAGILGSAIGGDGDGDDDGDGDGDDGDDDGDDAAECETEQEDDSDNETGASVMGGLLNLNNLALQGDNVAVLSNGLCGSIFLNDLLGSVLGLAVG
jgi:hypothetical protein